MIIWTEGLLILVFLVLVGANAFVLGRRKTDREAHVSEVSEIDMLTAMVAESREENLALRQRLEVLERLATDEDVELAKRINRLKDEDDERPTA